MVKTTKISPKQRTTGYLIAALFAWALPLTWVSALPPVYNIPQAESTSLKFLKQLDRIVETFVVIYKRTPLHFAELRAFAKAKQYPHHLYDAFGERLEYLRLDDKHYIVRSFGRDGLASGLDHFQDIVIARLEKKNGVKYIANEFTPPHFYPVYLLDGGYSSDNKYVAQIYPDNLRGQKRLVVTSLSDNISLVAANDAADEFFWLNGSRTLVYTTSKTSRHDGGMYIWDLQQNLTYPVFLKSANQALQVKTLGNQPKYGMNRYFSLAGVNEDSQQTYLYFFYKESAAFALAPETFFHGDCLYLLTVGNKGTDRSIKIGPVSHPKEINSQSLIGGYLGARENGLNSAHAIQKDWNQLPLTNDAEDVINKWQEFIAKNPQTTITAYAMWSLSQIYSNIAQATEKSDPRNSDILRSYGYEIASAVSKIPTAPDYLKALAQHQQNLLANHQFSNLRFLK